MTWDHQSFAFYQSLFCEPQEWKKKMKKKRNEVFSWTAEEIDSKLNNLEKNIFALEDFDEPEYSDFWGLLSCHGILSEKVRKVALEEEVYNIPEIYYHSSEETENILADRLLHVINSQEATEIMICLAMQGGDRALATLLDLERNPRRWQEILYIQPSDYAKYGGWTFDKNGKRQILNFDICYAMEESGENGREGDKAARIGRIREDFCPVCHCRMIDLLVLDGRDPRLRFLEIDGIFTATCCPNCICTNEVAFSRFEPDGQSYALTPEGYASAENRIREEQLEEIASNTYVLGKEPVSLFYGAAWQDIHTVGGFASWLGECSYTQCPHCGRTMKYVAQIQWDMITEGAEGTLYIEFCPKCRIVSTQYQYL